MKTTEFKKIIREEVKKALNEVVTPVGPKSDDGADYIGKTIEQIYQSDMNTIIQIVFTDGTETQINGEDLNLV